MAFFNLTQLGVQDPFKTARSKPSPSKPSATSAAGASVVTETRDVAAAADTTTCTTTATTSPLATTAPGTKDMPLTNTDLHKNSYTKYKELHRKHHRPPQGPGELYHYPLTTSQNYGHVHDNAEKASWAQPHRHPHVNSEMTRFVDDMNLTNKEFSLF